MKKVSLADIVSAVGVSKFSVSRALAGKSGVSEETRELVVETAKRLGYRVKPGRQRLIFQFDLVVYNDADMTEFWMGVITGAQREAKRLGVYLITRPIHDAEESLQPAGGELDGVIGGSGLSRELLERYRTRGVKTVLISTPAPGDPWHSVTIADEEGAFAVGRHLQTLGHVALAFVTDRVAKTSFANRERGLRRYAGDKGLEYRLIEVNGHEPGRSFEGVFGGLLKNGGAPTGLYCATDSLAFAVIHALNRLGLGVPRDVSVVGVYNTFESRSSVPRLTTLDVPREEIGKLAVRQLYALVATQEAFVPTRVQVAPSLVIRESTAKAGKGNYVS